MSKLLLDIVRDLKRVNAHLAAAAYPILKGRGELLPTRLKQVKEVAGFGSKWRARRKNDRRKASLTIALWNCKRRLPACATGERPAHAPPGSSRQASRESRKSWPKKATEVVIEAVRGERSAVINESVDLIYNLVVLWSELGITAREVWAEMDRRQALLGLAEKLPKEVGVGSTSSAGP